MTVYQVNYRTRLEGWEESTHVIAENLFEAVQIVSKLEGRPIPLSVFETSEVDHVK